MFKRIMAALTATTVASGLLLVGAAGAASADTRPFPHDHDHGLIGDITIIAPVTIVDNALAILGIAGSVCPTGA